jgi:hypothetical protein
VGENEYVFKTTRSWNEGDFMSANRGTKVMPELVTPELTLVRVADKGAEQVRHGSHSCRG